MPRPKLNRQRVNITLPNDLLKRLDEHAASAGKTRSDVIEEAVDARLGPAPMGRAKRGKRK